MPRFGEADPATKRRQLSETEMEAMELSSPKSLKNNGPGESAQYSAAVPERKGPAEIFREKDRSMSIDLGATALHVDKIDTDSQAIPVHVNEVQAAPAEASPMFVIPEATSGDSIPEEVVAEVAARVGEPVVEEATETAATEQTPVSIEVAPNTSLSYADFLEQRVPGKELAIIEKDDSDEEPTEEELIKRRKAQMRNMVKSKGQVHIGGKFAKKADYAVYDAIIDSAHEEALKDAETIDRSNDGIIRDNVEGEFLVKKEPRLQGLLSIGEDLLALKQNGADEKDIEAKTAVFDDLFELYSMKDLDSRALGFIADATYQRATNPDFIPVEGSAYLDGEKAKVVDFLEFDDGTKAYMLEKEDGSKVSISSVDVEFRREFAPVQVKPETEVADGVADDEPVEPETAVVETADIDKAEVTTDGEDETAVVAPEAEKLSRFERAKKLLSGSRLKQIQEFAGKVKYSHLWNAPNNWLSGRGMTPDMTPEQVQDQKNKNRTLMLMAKTGVLIGIGVGSLIGLGLEHSGVSDTVANGTPDLGGGIDTSHAEHGLYDAEVPVVPHLPEGEPLDLTNPAYDIPDGGSVSDMFGDLHIDTSKIADVADTLRSRFPGTFNGIGDDVRIAQPGPLPTDVRTYIESLR